MTTFNIKIENKLKIAENRLPILTPLREI